MAYLLRALQKSGFRKPYSSERNTDAHYRKVDSVGLGAIYKILYTKNEVGFCRLSRLKSIQT